MQMTENELSEVISRFQMPQGRYLIEQEGSFGRGEFFWIIKNQSTNQKVSTNEYLLTSWCRG